MKIVLWSIAFTAFFFAANAQLVQWRGPDRDGHFPESGLLNSWPASGPELILEAENIGKGWSSPILAGDTIYITGMIDNQDHLTAVDMKGNILWQVPYGPSWFQSYPDTRCSPVVEGDRIYVQSGSGRLACIARETGKEIWAVDVDKDFETVYANWGNSETPLIVDDKVISTPAGTKTSVVAFNKMTGELVWQTKPVGGTRSFASATLFDYNNHRYILAVTGTHLLAVDPENGEIAWNYRYHNPSLEDRDWLIWTNTPVVQDDEIFLSMGYNYPAIMLKMNDSGTSVSEKFTNKTLDNHHHGLIYYNGYLYGSNWLNNRQGNWVCMDWETGEIMYEDEWESKGVLVMADNMLYAYNERGSVGLVKPVPENFEVVSEFKISSGAGPHWAHPFIKDGKLLMRHGEVLLVFDIKS